MKNELALRCLIIFFTAMLLLTFVSRGVEAQLIANVHAAEPTRSALVHSTLLEGTVETAELEMIWTLAELRVNHVPVSAGDHVKVGDTLAVFDEDGLTALVDQAQRSVELLMNERSLRSLDTPTTEEEELLERHRLLLSSLDIRIETAQRDLNAFLVILRDDNRLLSPLGGVIWELNIRAGMATTDNALMQIASDDTKRSLICQVPVEQANFIAQGDTAYVAPTGSNTPRNLTVLSVTPTNDGNVSIALEVPNEGYDIGLVCSVEFTRITDHYPAVVPLTALHNDAQGDYVLIPQMKKSILGDTQIAARIPISILDNDNASAAIRGAIQDGDLVITDWDKTVNPGDRVRLILP